MGRELEKQYYWKRFIKKSREIAKLSKDNPEKTYEIVQAWISGKLKFVEGRMNIGKDRLRKLSGSSHDMSNLLVSRNDSLEMRMTQSPINQE